jgi:hypothetical protein
MKEKYGFVYRWYDKKHDRFYIGCHWGFEDDGYICSSSWMRKAYRRRFNDFNREILVSNINDRQETFLEEYKFLYLIPNEELGKKYYNLTKCFKGCGIVDEEKFKTSKDKFWWTDGINNIRSNESPGKEWFKGRTFDWNCRTGRTHSDKSKQIMSERKKGKTGQKRTEEVKIKLSEIAKKSQKGIRWWNNGEITVRSKGCPGENWKLGRIISWKLTRGYKKINTK